MDAVDVGSEGLAQYIETTLEEVFKGYDVVDMHPGIHDRTTGTLLTEPYVVVSRKLLADSGTVDLRELGYTSMSPWTAWTRDERIPELRDKQGIRKWYDLKRNDGTVRGTLLNLKTPIRAAHWFFEPASDSALDKNISKFVEENLFENLNVDWSQVLDDILLMFEYGYMAFEKVWDFNDDGKLVLKKLAPRHPLDIQEWIFDDRGGPAGIVMEPFVPYGNQSGSGFAPGFPFPTSPTELATSLGQFIPISKLVIFSFEPEAGDLRGTSVLRSAYKHWYYKDTLYKIDAIQKERHGIGVPVIVLPPGFTADDKKLADELGRNLRTNDRAHIVIPSNWQIMFAKLEGQPVSAIESIDHHNDQIKANILSNFMDSDNAGDNALDMFFKSTRYLAMSISNIINRFVIRELVDKNFKRGKYPKLHARRIGEWNDLRTLSFAIRNFVGAGLITPDDVLEASLREESDLPPMDKATARPIMAPQTATGDGTGDAPGDSNSPKAPAPSRAGLPRQGAPSTKGAGAANTGRDASGGK